MENKLITFEFGEILMLFRKRAGLSQGQVAKRLKVTPATIAKYESSKTIPSYSVILAFKKIFGEEFMEILKVINEQDGEFEGNIYCQPDNV